MRQPFGQLYCGGHDWISWLPSPRHPWEQLSRVGERSIVKHYEGLKNNIALHLIQDSIVTIEQCVSSDGEGSLCYQELTPSIYHKEVYDLGHVRCHKVPRIQQLASPSVSRWSLPAKSSPQLQILDLRRGKDHICLVEIIYGLHPFKTSNSSRESPILNSLFPFNR